MGKWENFKLRHSDLKQDGTQPVALGVFFPLIAVLLPKWLNHASQRAGRHCVYLISGSGIPREQCHDVAGNSTECVARLMESFIRMVHPNVEVVQLPSSVGIFRFDDNVAFTRDVLLPKLDAERQVLVQHYREAWHERMQVTQSLTDGAPARVAAISTALRRYKPDFLHMYELKAFWHSSTVCLEDVDYHNFDTVNLSPPRAVHTLPPMERQVVAAMQHHRDRFLHATAQSEHEMSAFWLRKSKKPVLSVLLVQRPNSSAVTYCGVNMEVSMPTGSLCAERCAIGQALARDPALRREHMKAVAVLSVALAPPVPAGPARLPVGGHKRPKPADASAAAGPLVEKSPKRARSSSPTAAPGSPKFSVPPLVRTVSLSSMLGAPSTHQEGPPSPNSESSFVREDVGEVRLNPLPPCGSCSEWLKKIAEVNPEFKIVTFTDTSCSTAFVRTVD